MAIRAFVTATLDDLTKAGGIIASLEKALQQGSTEELRNNHTGFLIRTGPLTPIDLQRLYAQALYEAYLRVLTMDDSDQSKAALKLQWTDPYKEKVMNVEVIRRFRGGAILFTTPPNI